MAAFISLQVTGLDRAIGAHYNLAKKIRAGMPELFRILGNALVINVQHRIITRDEGKWAGASKWTRAKTGYEFPTLLGAEKYVRMRASAKKLVVYGATGKGWTLTQHHTGFVNALTGPDDHFDGDRVILKIKDGEPLGLYQEHKTTRNGALAIQYHAGKNKMVPVFRATVFEFVPKTPGVTPARKIWPTAGEVQTIGQPIASEWLRVVVREAGFT